jgi:hypothetical protein
MDNWIKRIIIDHMIRKKGLLSKRVSNFQIGDLPPIIIIRSLKIKNLFLFLFFFLIFFFFGKDAENDMNTLRTYFLGFCYFLLFLVFFPKLFKK